ncbi:hypothetical protein SCALM49S_08125 [Streptomyces californicus]
MFDYVQCLAGRDPQPSDAALTFDLKAQKDLGFNAVRKHIKVESPRWYYHADRLGLLVWQDFVNADIDDDAGKNAFLTQGKEMMKAAPQLALGQRLDRLQRGLGRVGPDRDRPHRRGRQGARPRPGSSTHTAASTAATPRGIPERARSSTTTTT